MQILLAADVPDKYACLHAHDYSLCMLLQMADEQIGKQHAPIPADKRIQHDTMNIIVSFPIGLVATRRCLPAQVTRPDWAPFVRMLKLVADDEFCMLAYMGQVQRGNAVLAPAII